MSSSLASQYSHGHAEASSSRPPSGRTANGKQPAIEDEANDEEALLADDPLNGGLSEQYA